MSWVFLDGTKFTSAETLHEMTFDGRDMWTTADANKVKIYSFWGDSDGTEIEIDLTLYLTDAKHIVKAYNEMFVFNDAVTEFIRINIGTKAVIDGTQSVRYSTNCVPAFGNFKIWFVTAEEDNVQSLYYYDTTNGSWSDPVAIPGRHQSTKRKIVWGNSDYIYVTQVNESGVAKFNANTGAYINQRTTNRMPAIDHDLIVNGNRDILIAGFNGMVSSVDQDTDIATNISGINEVTDSLQDDGTYLWSVKPSLARITKGSTIDNYQVMAEVPAVVGEVHNEVYFTYGFALDQRDITSLSSVKEGGISLVEGLDYTFEVDDTFDEQRLTIIEDAPNVLGVEPLTITVNYSYTTQLTDYNIIGFTDTTFKQVITTPEYTHEYWDGTAIQTRTEEQRVALLADNAIYFPYNFADSWDLDDTREYELTIKGTALVGTGPNTYHGETQ